LRIKFRREINIFKEKYLKYRIKYSKLSLKAKEGLKNTKIIKKIKLIDPLRASYLSRHIVIDENNKTTFVNQKMCEIIGYSIDEMMGKSNFFFKDEADLQTAIDSHKRRRQGEIYERGGYVFH
jgi:hypothetical protein